MASWKYLVRALQSEAVELLCIRKVAEKLRQGITIGNWHIKIKQDTEAQHCNYEPDYQGHWAASADTNPKQKRANEKRHRVREEIREWLMLLAVAGGTGAAILVLVVYRGQLDEMVENIKYQIPF